MRNHVLEVLKRTTATVAITAMLLCGVTACSSGGSTGGGSDDTQIRYSDGSVYTGDTQNGLRSGYGEFQWKDGSCYTGMWQADKISGNGNFTTSEGISWIGTFSNSAFQYAKYAVVGQGLDGNVSILATKNQTSMLYEYTKATLLGGTELKKMAYEGDLTKAGEFSGNAVIGYWNGDVFSGTVSHGKKVKGIYAFQNGDRSDGSLSPSRKNGQEKCEKSRMKQTGANESKVKRQKLHTAAFQNRRAISIQSKSEDELCCRKLQYKQRYRSVPPAWSGSGADEPAHISDS